MNKIDCTHLRFLIIDDNQNFRAILRQMLNGFGCRDVLECANTVTAMETLHSAPRDMILCDSILSDGCGIEFTKKLRNDPTKAINTLPIIMVSARAERKTVSLARDAGVHEFLIKPVSAKALYDRIVNVIVNPREFVRVGDYVGPDRRRFESPVFQNKERRKNSAAESAVMAEQVS